MTHRKSFHLIATAEEIQNIIRDYCIKADLNSSKPRELLDTI